MDENLSDAIVMNLVVNSGEARSIAMEAIELARQGQFEEATAKIAQARETINAAHNFQTELVQKEINNDPVPMSLLMCHGQDHLMTAMVVIDLAENSGQHNALMAALRHADGDVIIGMDDDGQTHPSQLGKLFETFDQGYDLVYGYYPEKKHNWFRNLGSRFNDLTINLMIRKPKEVRTSSYFLARKFIRDYSVEYHGSYTYLLGLFMRCTQNIASVPIKHFDREVGESNYTLKQLIRLWSSIIGFSVIPLRVASVTGFLCAGAALLAALIIVIWKFVDPTLSMGWPSLMCAITFFFGLNFMFLGMIGEYLGRMFLGMNKEPQYVIRETYNVEKKGLE